MPSLLANPFEWLFDAVLELLLDASRFIGELNTFADLVPDVIFFIEIHKVKEAHAILFSAVRGENKLPGEVRRSQNWIGGADIKSATFVPPAHEDLPDLLTDLEKFWHGETRH